MGLTTPTPGHENRDIRFGAILLFAFVLAALIGIVHVVVTAWEKRRPPVPAVEKPLTPPRGPGLLVNQSRDMEQLRALEEATLHSYGWVDQERGIVRIPIERAMELVAEREGKTP